MYLFSQPGKVHAYGFCKDTETKLILLYIMHYKELSYFFVVCLLVFRSVRRIGKGLGATRVLAGIWFLSSMGSDVDFQVF